jgi:hypothetical protein
MNQKTIKISKETAEKKGITFLAAKVMFGQIRLICHVVE